MNPLQQGEPAGSPSSDDLKAAARRLIDAGDAPSSVPLLTRALASCPEDAAALELLARAHHLSGQLMRALHGYDELVRRGAATARTWLDMGRALRAVGESAQARGAFERGLARDRRSPEAHALLADALFDLGEADRAMKHLKAACASGDLPGPRMSRAILAPAAPATSPRAIRAIREELAAWLARQAQGSAPTPAPAMRPPPGEPLRIGYLSAHFHQSNYMKPVWALLNRHDRTRFQVHLFSDSPDGTTLPGWTRHPTDVRHDVAGLSNAELAQRVASSGVHVLTDLSGYSEPRRLGAFLAPMAPVVVAWFNSFATTGLPGFHYIVGDDEVVLPGEDRFFSETVVRLPLSYLTFEVQHDAPPVAEPPCLRTGVLTFGSLVARYKITPDVLDAWAAILTGAPGSRLLVANRAMASLQERRQLADELRRRGVTEDRLTIRGPAEHSEYLRNYDDIDLALDAFPYNGGTTTMEAIWQGVPVLTFAGDRWASRTSQSLLRRTHLAGFVAPSRRGMIRMGVELARNPGSPAALRDLRSGMRNALSRSLAMDSASLAREMEAFYALAVARSAGAA